ncbi:MAG: hypothetical protein B6241_00820 [Spirochaetaceae bacterium 4572_59]|nr:MAG: hypothetical protein B6241_00820 [Spirochaetaceae bacterium 4572_59]
MKKIKLVFGTYNTQPLGLQEHLYEEAYQKAYKPFLTTVYNYPELALSLHYSGPLLSWLEKRHPEFITVLREMVDRKQVEILGGSYFEPILPLIPSSDRVGQIEMMITYLRKTFGRRSRGFWISGNLWENQLAYTLKSCGMEYFFLDERIFSDAGVREKRLFDPVLTEDQGKTMHVLPLCHRLSQRMFHDSPEQIIASLKDFTEKAGPSPVVSLLLSGESMSVKSSRKAVLCDSAWLEEFFLLLQNNREWINSDLPGKIIRSNPLAEKRYFPTTTFTSLMEWSQSDGIKDKNDYRHYRHFLTNYRESTLLYSKMMYTQVQVNQVRGDKYRKKSAREELWKGQNHSPYWHGPDRGLYDIQLRHNAYRFLIEAEKVTREKGIFIPALTAVDFDMDGRMEYLYQGYTMNAYAHQKGGTLFELDYLPSSWNYLNTMSRYQDFSSLSSVKLHDSYSRKGFHDHFLEDVNLKSFMANNYSDSGDFLNGVYDVQNHNREKQVLVFSRNGSVSTKGRKSPLKVKKQYNFKRNSIELQYEITNMGYEKCEYCFGSEFNLALPAPETYESRFCYINQMEEFLNFDAKPTELTTLKILQIQDLMNNTTIQVDYSLSPEKFWSFPLETAYVYPGSETVESLYQGTTFLPQWQIILFPGESWILDISLKIGKSKGKAFA